jgi:hypothetical protein
VIRLRGFTRMRTGTLEFHRIRTLLSFADVKPVRVDPRGEAPAGG